MPVDPDGRDSEERPELIASELLLVGVCEGRGRGSRGSSRKQGRGYCTRDRTASQPAAVVAVRETGRMWANMLRAFQVGNALASDGRPST